MALLNRAQARKQVKPRTQDVPFPELGGEIRFVEFAGDEWPDFDKKAPQYLARLIVSQARAEDGTTLFKPEDINFVATWPEHMKQRGGDAVLRISGLLAGSEDEILKNSPATPSTPPSGESPSPEA